MRSRGIQAGDIVQVVRDCCGRYLGLVFTVEKLEYIRVPLHCQHCGWKHEGELLVAWIKDRLPLMMISPAAWLKRFEPPAESIAEINRLWEPKRETIKVPR